MAEEIAPRLLIIVPKAAQSGLVHSKVFSGADSSADFEVKRKAVGAFCEQITRERVRTATCRAKPAMNVINVQPRALVLFKIGGVFPLPERGI